MNGFRMPVSAVALVGVALSDRRRGRPAGVGSPGPRPAAERSAAGTGVRIGTAVDMAALAEDTTYRRTSRHGSSTP